LSKNSKILDFGCAAGETIDYLSKVCDCIFHGYEVDPRFKNIHEDKQYKIYYEAKSLQKSFCDCVILTEVIEHIYDIDEALSLINHVLIDNGILIITTPNSSKILAFLRLLAGRFDSHYHNPFDVHIRFFTKNSLKKLLKKYGFVSADISERIFFRSKVFALYSFFSKV